MTAPATDFALQAQRDSATLAARFAAVRALSLALAAPLTPEDQQVQTMADVSPTKWHLAHTSWFFETFLLQPLLTGYRLFHPRYGYLFNSYYEAVGPRHERARRGDLSRPSLGEILDYRAHVDAGMNRLLASEASDHAVALIELGLHHEQQHQELILMDIKHVFGCNPLAPVYVQAPPVSTDQPVIGRPAPLAFHDIPGGRYEIGARSEDGFCFDNETPRHAIHLIDYRLASRPVSNGEFLEFIQDGGYGDARHWLADGWAWRRAEEISQPLYWRGGDTDGWREFTLTGDRPLDQAAPVCHVSYYEADAFARWAGHRLPSEGEWEHAVQSDLAGGELEAGANLLASGHWHPIPSMPTKPGAGSQGLRQMFGDVWEWTASAYSAYPGFRPSPGAVGEYNGKFMANQMVLRGGCALTPPGHLRPSYRNFFYPHQRWPMTGIRLASDG